MLPKAEMQEDSKCGAVHTVESLPKKINSSIDLRGEQIKNGTAQVGVTGQEVQERATVGVISHNQTQWAENAGS